MKTQNNIFASNSERKNYYKLLERWGEKYRIHQNIPFLRVFDVKPDEVRTKGTFEYLKKTSIDYVLCDTNDRPLLAVEYDGVQQGISVGTTYVPGKVFAQSRAWGIETKLDVAYQCAFPLIVVSDTEFDYLAGTGLMVIDGLIGTILAKQAFKREFQERNFEKFLLERYEITPEQFEHLPRDEQQGYFESFGVDVEIDTEWDNNPVVRRRWKIYNVLDGMTAIHEGKVKRSTLLYSYGTIPAGDKRFVKGEFKYTQSGETLVEKAVILPNFQVPQLIYTGGLAVEIAALLASIELAKRWGVDTSSIE